MYVDDQVKAFGKITKGVRVKAPLSGQQMALPDAMLEAEPKEDDPVSYTQGVLEMVDGDVGLLEAMNVSQYDEVQVGRWLEKYNYGVEHDKTESEAVVYANMQYNIDAASPGG
jgi:hypothetical protein